MVQNRDTTKNWEVGPGGDDPLGIGRIVDLACDTNRNSPTLRIGPALDVTNDLDQRTTMPMAGGGHNQVTPTD